MKEWNKQSVVEWLKDNAGETVIIKMSGTTLRLEGQTKGVDKIDACSTEIEETEMDFGQENINISISFHENSLSIHFMANKPGTKKVAISMPISISYGLLYLSTPKEEELKGRSAANKRAEPEFSPYELLR